MGLFHEWKILELLDELKKGEITPDYMVSGEWTNYTILQALINSETFANRLVIAQEFIDLGCDPDQYGAGSGTAISLAASNGSWQFVEFLLDFHKKGHSSDLNILRSAASSIYSDTFKKILLTKKVDVNTTQLNGKHILHHLVFDNTAYENIKILWERSPEIVVNPIDKKGQSPLTISLNNNYLEVAKALAENKESLILGKLTNSHGVIDLEIIDRFNGDFWSLPDNPTQYALDVKKDYLLPDTVKDIFLF